MDKQERFIKLRTKMVGALMYDARQASRRTVEECAEVMGVSPEQYRDFEKGAQAPSLPALESLAYFLNVPLDHFWGRQSRSQQQEALQAENQRKLRQLRDRLIGVQIKQARIDANLSSHELSEKTGIAEEQLKSYEMGQASIPLPQVDALTSALNLPVEQLFDQRGPIGKWRMQQQAMQQFDQLPEDLKSFVAKPVNQPYIELAMRLSEMSVEKLRTIAEGLLEITY